MMRAVNGAQLVAYALWPVRLKPSPWWPPNASEARKNCTVKRNMRPAMKSICYVAYFAGCVKRPARKKPYFSRNGLPIPIITAKASFLTRRSWLNRSIKISGWTYRKELYLTHHLLKNLHHDPRYFHFLIGIGPV